VGLRDMARYQAWREERAASLIGPYAVKTAGAFVNEAQRRTADGWLYGGRDGMCFFADNPVELAYMSPPGQVDQRTLVIAYQDCDEPIVRSAPGAPNLILDFGGGREFVGARDRMEHLLRLWHMWRGAGAGAELWDATAEIDGMPLYQRSSRLPSRPGQTLLGFLVGLAAVLYGVWGAVNDSGGPILAGTWPQGAFLALLLLGALVLLGRWVPNGIAGFCIAAVPGAIVVAIIQFATGTAGSGWLLLGAAVGLVVVRILVAQAAGRRADSRSSFYN
jgi:hypothetical protein